LGAVSVGTAAWLLIEFRFPNFIQTTMMKGQCCLFFLC
jgi:hypothetical protein